MAISDISWRLIELETHDAFMNMALDEACCESVASGANLSRTGTSAPAGAWPTIRFYRWQPSSVSIGYFQSLQDEIAVDECERAGVSVVRRRTGGGAVYHDFEGEITYSVMVAEKDFCGADGATMGITESYREICGWIIDALGRVGIACEFKPINDVIVSASGKKISGNAQTRRNGVILQHGTILWRVDVRKMFSLLKVGKEKIADKLIAAVEERVTSVSDVCVSQGRDAISRETLYEALKSGFTEGKKFEVGAWTEAELQRASERVRERYRTKEWNEMR